MAAVFGWGSKGAAARAQVPTREESLARLRKALDECDAVVIGAGAGLSTAAGLAYDGERFQRYFGDFGDKYHFADMYSGGFYPYATLEEFWTFWSRYIYINRYVALPDDGPYQQLLDLVREKNYFVLTTNVDHCFQRAGFSKDRLFYTQGDYGLWQCSEPCHQKTYDNRAVVEEMLKCQGFSIADDGELTLPEGVTPAMAVPEECVPHCPVCGKPMSMNLRSDDTFVEDEGWHRHAKLYANFMQEYSRSRVLFLELGVGYNTPGIIKYPFWQYTARNPRATYACLNLGQAAAPKEILLQSALLDGDIASTLAELR